MEDGQEEKAKGAEQEEGLTPTMESKKHSMDAICSSSVLDNFLAHDSSLKVSYNVPMTKSVDFCTSVKTTDDKEYAHDPVVAGLGNKRKGTKNDKPRTLLEKRAAVEAEIEKYGREAVSNKYAMQDEKSREHRKSHKSTPIKMKPKPSGFSFEEKDAREILKPNSLHKYIHEPAYDSVVYISRRDGIVPLFSLCKDSKTVLSSNVKLLQGRNVSLGKPSVYVKSEGRLLAIGGSRAGVNGAGINIVKVPKLHVEVKDECLPYTMDDEFVKHALQAIIVPKALLKEAKVASSRVDIRTVKKIQKAKEVEEKRIKNMTSTQLIDHLFDKVVSKPKEAEEERENECSKQQKDKEEEKAVPMEEEDVKLVIDMPSNTGDVKEAVVEEEEESNPVLAEQKPSADAVDEKTAEKSSIEIQQVEDTTAAASSPVEKVTSSSPLPDPESENQDPNKKSAQELSKPGPKSSKAVSLHSSWKEDRPAFAHPDIERTAIVTDEFVRKRELSRKQPLAGVLCDVDGCFCSSTAELDTAPVSAEQMVDTGGANSEMNTESHTPASGTMSPAGKGLSGDKSGEKKRVKNKLHKVKRALKSLGVSFYEFDEDGAGNENACDKEFCSLGCICDTISGKPIPPAHCGKEPCMFHCFCSEDSAQYSSSKKVGISPTGAAKLRSSSQRHLAAEERKFSNTVVATSSGRDVVMLGASGRQKRERKMPSRYQDSNSVAEDGTGSGPDGKDISYQDDMAEADDYRMVDRSTDRLKARALDEVTTRSCCVLIPLVKLPSETRVWCLFHCQYSCPCAKFRNPLDFAPDRNIKRAKPKCKKILDSLKNLPPGSKRKAAVQVEGSKAAKKPAAVSPKVNSSPKTPAATQSLDPSVVMTHSPSHSARTAGYNIKPSVNDLKLPHKIVRQKSSSVDTGLNLMGALKKSGSFRVSKPVLPQGSSAAAATDDCTLDLSIKPKGSAQSVKWHVLKKAFDTDNIVVYVYQRNHRPIIFVTRKNEAPYVSSAENVKSLSNDQLLTLPSSIQSLARPLGAESDDGDNSAILQHNGLAWELNGLLKKKISPGEIDKMYGSADRVSSNGKQSSCYVDADSNAMKLPRGQNLVTMKRSTDNSQAMQIKLPPTSKQQHWCTIRVEDGSGAASVQCPDSTLALKCSILKQATRMAMREETTVRIPIPVPGEVNYFGVYAVPGLPTHVFVGPFTNRVETVDDCPSDQGNEEVICLDSPPPENGADDDEVQFLPMQDASSAAAGGRRKQKLRAKLDEQDQIENAGIVGGLVESISNRAVACGERKIQRDKERRHTVIGQVPTVVEDAEDDDDVILIEDDGIESKVEQNKIFRQVADSPRVPYLNLPTSKYGKTVMKKYVGASPDDDSCRLIQIALPETASEKSLPATVRQRAGGIVVFPHPQLSGHQIVCNALDDAKKWLDEFYAAKETAAVKSDHSQPMKQTLKLKPMSDLTAGSSSSGGAAGDIVAGGRSIITGKREFVNPADGKRGVAIFLDHIQPAKEQSQLFFELGRAAYNREYFKGTFSRIQILQRARHEVLAAQGATQALEAEKRDLMQKRKRLFDQFTNELTGIPIELKKQKLMELRNIVKKKVPITMLGSEQPRKRERQHHPQQPRLDAPILKYEPPQRHEQILTPPPLAFMKTAADNSRKDQQQQQHPIGNALSSHSPPALSASGGPFGHGPTPYSDATGLKTVKKDGKVLRPMNAFMLWAKDHRKTLISNGFDGATVSKMLADEWKTLTDQHKQQFYTESENLKNLHQLQHPDYKYSPRSRKNPRTPRNARAAANTAVNDPATTFSMPPLMPMTPSNFSSSSPTTTGSQASFNRRIAPAAPRLTQMAPGPIVCHSQRMQQHPQHQQPLILQQPPQQMMQSQPPPMPMMTMQSLSPQAVVTLAQQGMLQTAAAPTTLATSLHGQPAGIYPIRIPQLSSGNGAGFSNLIPLAGIQAMSEQQQLQRHFQQQQPQPHFAHFQPQPRMNFIQMPQMQQAQQIVQQQQEGNPTKEIIEISLE